MAKKEINQSNQNKEYNILIENVGIALKNSRQNIANTINTEIVLTYWQIGKYIIDYEQKGNEKAEYGSNMLNKLSSDLTQKYGKGFSRSNVFYIRKFYMEYPKIQTVSELLSWSHYVELLKIEQSEERSFYEIDDKDIENPELRAEARKMAGMDYNGPTLEQYLEDIAKKEQK